MTRIIVGVEESSRSGDADVVLPRGAATHVEDLAGATAGTAA